MYLPTIMRRQRWSSTRLEITSSMPQHFTDSMSCTKSRRRASAKRRPRSKHALSIFQQMLVTINPLGPFLMRYIVFKLHSFSNSLISRFLYWLQSRYLNWNSLDGLFCALFLTKNQSVQVVNCSDVCQRQRKANQFLNVTIAFGFLSGSAQKSSLPPLLFLFLLARVSWKST